MAWTYSFPYYYETGQLPVPSNGNPMAVRSPQAPVRYNALPPSLYEQPGVPATFDSRFGMPAQLPASPGKAPYAGEPLSEAVKNFSGGGLGTLLKAVGGAAGMSVPALAASMYFNSTPANGSEQDIYDKNGQLTAYGQHLKASMAPAVATSNAPMPGSPIQQAMSADTQGVPLPRERPHDKRKRVNGEFVNVPDFSTLLAGEAIPGFNPNVGNMADPRKLNGGGYKARQVYDPVSGQMVNDFYKKTLFGNLFGG